MIRIFGILKFSGWFFGHGFLLANLTLNTSLQALLDYPHDYFRIVHFHKFTKHNVAYFPQICAD